MVVDQCGDYAARLETVQTVLRLEHHKANGHEGQQEDEQRSEHDASHFFARVRGSSHLEPSEHGQRDVGTDGARLVVASANVTAKQTKMETNYYSSPNKTN